MTELAGGGVAAFGFQYQYLVTLEFFFRFLRDNPELISQTALVIEPIHRKADGKDDDVVDFAVELDGEPAYNAQVKSSTDPSTYPLQPASARKVIERLVAYPATHTTLLTNKPVSPDLLKEVTAHSDEATGPWSVYSWPKGPQKPASPGLIQPRIVVDTRTPLEIREATAELVRALRQQRRLRHGIVSAHLLVSILLDYVFSAAAGEQPSRITALDLLEKVAMPDARISQVAGGFDWGLPITNIPQYLSAVSRLTYLDDVQSGLQVDEKTAQPRRVVLTGQTGNGKTVLASDYCHIEAISYEFMCWIDCREVDLIEPQIRNIIPQLTQETFAPDAAIGSTFAGMLGRVSGPWLLVFDGAQSLRDIETYIPSIGHGAILVTTNNSLSWWPDAPPIEVGEMTDDEAVDCFAVYAGLTPDEAADRRAQILDIVGRLGGIALAVSMSAIYFKNTEGQLNELALQYFSDLEALADSDARPPGYPRTAFAAIQHAVRNLGKGTQAGATYGKSARAVLEIGALLAPELLPLNFMLLATAEEVQVDLAKLPPPAEVDRVLRRGVLSTLRTQTIARRVVNDGQGGLTPVSETIAMHPLVHEILRRSYLDAVPPGYLQSQCTVFMYFFVGWLGVMRSGGEYFAVEQLRMHANALLALTNESEPMQPLSPQNDRVYTYVKALLQAELGTCAASRGRLQAGLELTYAAVQTLAAYGHEPYARRIAMQFLANMLADMTFVEAPPEAVRACAQAFISAITEGESDARLEVRNLAYTLTSETLAVLNRNDFYRDSPLLVPVRERLLEVTQRDPAPETRNATHMNRVNELYDNGRFAELLDLANEMLDANTSLEGSVGLLSIKIAAQLHTGAVDEALVNVDSLLETRNFGDYVLLSLHEALKKVGRELYKVLDLASHGSVRPQLQDALARVMQRYNELSEVIVRGGTD